MTYTLGLHFTPEGPGAADAPELATLPVHAAVIDELLTLGATVILRQEPRGARLQTAYEVRIPAALARRVRTIGVICFTTAYLGAGTDPRNPQSLDLDWRDGALCLTGVIYDAPAPDPVPP